MCDNDTTSIDYTDPENLAIRTELADALAERNDAWH